MVFKMNERMRLLAVFNGEKPDITPWYADLSWWYNAQKEMGRLPIKYEGNEGYLRLHQDVGAGIYLYPPSVWKEEFDGSVQKKERPEGNEVISTITTPLGEIKSISKYLPDSFTSAYVEHYIKKPEDLQIMRYVFSHRRVTPVFDDFQRIDSLWNGWGIPCLLAPACVSPLQTILTRWAGPQTTVFLFADAQDELEQTVTELEKCDDVIFQIIANSPSYLIVFPDNLSGVITGRLLMERYEIPYWKKRIVQLHKAGKLVILHNDGALRASLPLLVETGIDGVEAITPAPAGDLTLDEVKGIAGGRVVIWGCLPGIFFSPLYPEDYFKKFIEKILKIFPIGSKFVLGVADQVPPDAEFSRICLVRKILQNGN